MHFDVSIMHALHRILESESNYYEVLDVPRDASEEELIRQYRKLAKEVHPDKNPSPKSEDAFKGMQAQLCDHWSSYQLFVYC